MSNWYLYIVRCNDGSLYTGITTDVKRRVLEHNTSKKGAKYTRSRRPVTLAMVQECHSRGEAASLEARTKSLTRKQKIDLISESSGSFKNTK